MFGCRTLKLPRGTPRVSVGLARLLIPFVILFTFVRLAGAQPSVSHGTLTLPMAALAAAINKAASSLPPGDTVKQVEFRSGVLKVGDKVLQTGVALVAVPAPSSVNDPKLQQTHVMRLHEGAAHHVQLPSLFRPLNVGHAQSGLLRVDLRVTGTYTQILRWLAAGPAIADSLVEEMTLEPVPGEQVTLNARLYIGDRVLDLLASLGRGSVGSALPEAVGRVEPFARQPAPSIMPNDLLDSVEWKAVLPGKRVLARSPSLAAQYMLQVGSVVARENARIVDIRPGEIIVELPSADGSLPGSIRSFAMPR